MPPGGVDETREESPDAVLDRGVSRRGALDPAGPCAGKKAPAAGQCEAGRQADEGRRQGLQVRARQDPGLEPEARPVGERARGAQAEIGGRGCARRLSAATSVPIPKFAIPCGTPSCELRNQRDTSKYM